MSALQSSFQSLCFFFLCTVDSFALARANVTNLYISTSVLFTFPFSHPFFFTCPVCGNFIPHVTLVLPSCMIFWITFHHFCLQGMPPYRTTPSIDFFEGCRLPHWVSHRKPIPWLATYFLQSLHTRRASPSVSISSWPYCMIVDPCFFFVSFEAE